MSMGSIEAELSKYDFLDWEYLAGAFYVRSENLDIVYWPLFLSDDVSIRAYRFLVDGVAKDSSAEGVYGKNVFWERRSVNMYGKKGYLARLVAWYADEEREYVFSRVKFRGHSWNEGLRYIKRKVEEKLGEKFNSALLNYYRDGGDYISWHTDAEKSLGVNPKIASVSLGGVRRFKLRNIEDKSKIFSIPLLPGSLLFMRGATQHHWQHAIDKEKDAEGRVNLTFRVIS